jgi:ElaB/YqjD/DUF883 family membrane-anchored ribosome-binding protein
MSTTVEEMILEGIRLTRAQERVGSLLSALQQQADMIDEVLEIAPDLAPEMNAMRSRISESCDHMRSALQTIQAKMDLL